MDTTLLHILLLTPVAFIAGFISAFAGASGVLMLPSLILVGVPAHVALGTNKLFTLFTTGSAALVYSVKQATQFRKLKAIIITNTIGAIAGVILVQYIPEQRLNQIIPYFLIFSALAIIKAFYQKTNSEPGKSQRTPKLAAQTSVGTTLGFYSGLFGPGIGGFWTATSMNIFKWDLLSSIGLSRMMCFIANIASTLVFIYYGTINYLLAAIIIVAGTLGSLLGSSMAFKVNKKILVWSIVIVTIISALSLMYY